jgi:mono/diheme cytochrome c family protein
MRTGVASKRRTRIVLLTLASLFGFGSFASSAQESSAVAANNQKWNYTALAKVPEKARAQRNPLVNDSDSVLAGGKLFQRHCAECHGMKAEGSKRAPSLLREEVQQATPGALFWVLTNGVVWHGMPVWSKLPEPQRWQIVAFLKSFRAPSGPQGATGSE